jgi:hypothetical protein
MTKKSAMTLSDAISLGRLLVEDPIPRELSRCALGMALLATGTVTKQSEFSRYESIRGVRTMFSLWPWLRKKEQWHCVKCGGHSFEREYGHAMIMHLFDEHVCTGEMRLEGLIQWVKNHEPKKKPRRLLAGALAHHDGKSRPTSTRSACR